MKPKSWPKSWPATRATATAPISPLKPAADAALLDTSDLDIDAAFAAALALVQAQGRESAQGPPRG